MRNKPGLERAAAGCRQVGGSEKDPRELQERTERRAKLPSRGVLGSAGSVINTGQHPPEFLSMQSEIGRKGHHHLKLGSKQR